MSKDYIQNISGGERRNLGSEVRYEKRDEKDVAGGYAALYNVRADLGWFEEEIAPGAFDDVLADDVRALFNHDANLVLARSINGQGTLRLFLDEKGLGYDFDIPDTTAGRDLKVNMELKNITQSSFGFAIEKEEWVNREGNEKDLRIIKKFKRLYDVSPVTFPAYQDTTVAKRSYDAIKQEAEERKTQEANKKTMSVFEARHMLNKNKCK